MPSDLDRILAAGFRPAGNWLLANGVLRLSLVQLQPTAQDLLYAFVAGGHLTYIGKTTQGLLRRMQGYRSPPNSAERGGSTNIRNHRNIEASLQAGVPVDIYVLDVGGEQRHGEFRINLAAGLEDSLIRELAPAWNGKGSAVGAAAKPTVSLPSRAPAAVRARSPIMLTGPLPSTSELMSFCRLRQGLPFTTAARGSEFLVEVTGGVLQVTPASSKKSRPVPEANVTAVLQRLGESGSHRSTDYQDISFHASYVLAVVNEWRKQVPSR